MGTRIVQTRTVDGATVEYVAIRVTAPEGSASATGYHTHYGWRVAGSRRRNLMTRAQAVAAAKGAR